MDTQLEKAQPLTSRAFVGAATSNSLKQHQSWRSNELGTVVHSQVTRGASFEAELIESVTSQCQSLSTLVNSSMMLSILMDRRLLVWSNSNSIAQTKSFNTVSVDYRRDGQASRNVIDWCITIKM